MVEIEDRSELCISKIVQVDEEAVAEMTNISQRHQQQEQSDNKEEATEFCIGVVLLMLIAFVTSIVKSSIVIRGGT